jgi:N-acetylmuramoyl-L-alanine amidase
MTEHVVQKGECLSLIAWSYGFTKWETVYEAPENEDFRTLRPNPNVIYPGDVLIIPDLDGRDESCPTEKRHRFRVAGSKWMLRIRMLDERGKPLTDRPYRLTIPGRPKIEAKTDSDGLLKTEVPADAKSATLFFMGQKTQLTLAGLDPVTRVTGVQQRLNNLGFWCGPVDGIVGPLTRRATHAFQIYAGIEADGIIGDQTRKALLDVHDKDDRSGTAEEEMTPEESPNVPGPSSSPPAGGFRGFASIIDPCHFIDTAYTP